MGKFIDMTGWKMSEHGIPDSRITIINKAPNMGKHTAWNCICECGNECIIRGDQLRSGTAKSCGCLFRELSAEKCRKVGKNNLGRPNVNRHELVGKVFGLLTVLDYYNTTVDGKAQWKCLCRCGEETIVDTSHLMSGHTKSCGCLLSAGEEKIGQILRENDISYISQYGFDDLKDKGKLRFDFAIFRNDKLYCLLEYQGSQHYQNLEGYTWNSPQEHDRMKREYCEKRGIPLIEICYKDFDKINFEYIKEKCGLCME